MINKEILICDINIRKQGHYIGYNQYILDHINELADSPHVSVSFLYNSAARDLLSFAKVSNRSISFLDIDLDLHRSNNGRVKIWKMVEAFASRNNVEHVLFLDFDKYQFPIGLSSCKFKVSGIYFRPHHRISTSNKSLLTRMLTDVKRAKKFISEKLLLINKNVSNVFILNDVDGVKYLNRKHKSSVFKFLPDPIFNYEEEELTELASSLEEDKFKFLLFGSITERKNTSNIIAAYAMARFKRNTSLYIVGPCEDAYLDHLNKLIKDHKINENPDKLVYIDCAYVTDGQMEFLHKKTNVSLLIYKDFYGSSGLIGRAAKHSMLTIAPNVGLLNEMVSKNSLGITTDPNEIKQIAEALEVASTRYADFDTSGCKDFYRDHSPSEFLKYLINTVTESLSLKSR